MLISPATDILGIFAFLYLFWKKLKDDYASTLIFSFAFYLLTGILLGLLISKFLFPAYWFWMCLIGICIFFTLGVWRFKLRIYETIEAMTFSLIPWIALTFVADAINTSSVSSFVAGFVCLLFIIFYAFLNANYKKFTWYSSGRVGFSGLAILAVFFLVRAAVAIFTPSVLSFVKQEVLISGITGLISILAIISLGKNKI